MQNKNQQKNANFIEKMYTKIQVAGVAFFNSTSAFISTCLFEKKSEFNTAPGQYALIIIMMYLFHLSNEIGHLN